MAHSVDGMKLNKKKTSWWESLIGINILGLVIVTLYSAFYNLCPIFFGVPAKEAIHDFFNTEMLFGIVFLIVWNGIAIVHEVIKLFRGHSKNEKDRKCK